MIFKADLALKWAGINSQKKVVTYKIVFSEFGVGGTVLERADNLNCRDKKN